MGKHLSDDGLNLRLETLFPVDDGSPCPEGTALLRAFAQARASDFAFLKPSDLVDLHNSAFTGISEWDAFSEHYGSCDLCNA
jgi:hypothetical protein